jgi:uncharacterized membrane protein YcaP (DUF421 family)
MFVALIGKDLWNGIPILEKVIRTVAVYFGLVILLRVGGKRDTAQLNSFDLVVLLVLANVVQNAIIGNDTSLSGGLLGAAVLVALNGMVVRMARRSPLGVRLFEGSPITLVEDGHFVDRALRRVGLRRTDVDIAVRRQGAESVAAAQRAVLEPGGTIVVDLKPDEDPVTAGQLRALEGRLAQRLDAIAAALPGAG